MKIRSKCYPFHVRVTETGYHLLWAPTFKNLLLCRILRDVGGIHPNVPPGLYIFWVTLDKNWLVTTHLHPEVENGASNVCSDSP